MAMDERRNGDCIAVDRNEQYSRKDAVHFSGIPHSTGETILQLEDKIINIVNKAEVQLKRELILLIIVSEPIQREECQLSLSLRALSQREKGVFFGEKKSERS